jgi:hypothetical protein
MTQHHPYSQQFCLQQSHRDNIIFAAMAEKRRAIADIAEYLALSAINLG